MFLEDLREQHYAEKYARALQSKAGEWEKVSDVEYRQE